jgi:hypothetical protein
VFCQSINTSYGKNRIQHHDDFNNWKKYETQNFLIYWYGKGFNVAKSVIQIAELDHDNIQGILEHRINDKIEIVVYVDITDMKQSNIGYEEAFSNQTGKTKIIGNKMFVHFDGDHQHLRTEIREGIASVYINSILVGSNLQEIVQNAILLDLPDWFREGLISYIGSRWDYEKDDELRDIFSKDESYYEFAKLSKDYPKIAGHSLWYFLDTKYGQTTIANVLYLTRINRNLRSSFLYVLNQSFDQILYSWEDWVFDYYEAENDKFDKLSNKKPVEIKKRDHVPISLIKFSPDEKELLYVDNEIGKYSVYILDIKTGERQRVFKHGAKNNFQSTDYNYPLACWHPNGKEISLVFEKRDIIYLRKINIATGEFIEQTLPANFQRVYSIDLWEEDRYVFSGTIDGYSDLLIYNAVGRTVSKITDDFFDDIEGVVIKDEFFNGILFKSNRPTEEIGYIGSDTILPLDNFDVFYLAFSSEGKPSLYRLTETENINEQQVKYIGKGGYAYLSDRNGLLNVYQSKDKLGGQAYSNFDRNIILQDFGKSKYAFTSYVDGAYKLYITELPDKPVDQKSTGFYGYAAKQKSKILFPVIEETEQKETYPDDWGFQSVYRDYKEDVIDIEATPESSELFSKQHKLPDHTTGLEKIQPERSAPSRLTFNHEGISTRLDNSVLFEGLESYIDGENELDFNAMGLLIKARTKDLFEDYIFEGGLRIPARFNGTEYFFSFMNNKKRIDRQFTVYRKAATENLVEGLINSPRVKQRTLMGQYRLKYPFDVYRSVRATASVRQDKQFLLSRDNPTLNAETFNGNRLSLKLEYVFDNSIDVGINVKHGTRYKVYTEIINGFDLKITDGFDFDPSTSFTTVLGFDARHYIPIGKHGVFALRSAGATSIGPDKVLYYIGGVEQDLLRNFNPDTPLPPKDFIFRAPAPNLRGFDTNVRNGSTFVLANTEIRLPVFKMLGAENIRLSLLRNLQLVTFFDAGLAWHGTSPFSDENPINTITVSNPPIVEVTVEYFRDPLILSYGAGIRTSLFGYFIRLDYGWGIETRAIQTPKFHLGLGTDF